MPDTSGLPPRTYAIASIQRDRGPWIVEWLAFHLLVGFNRFFIYAHKCRDDMTAVLLSLSRHYPISVYGIEHDAQPQLAAYRHAWAEHGEQVDWMAFLDGDEFLLPLQTPTIGEALAPFERPDLSALAVYWLCYGGNGHIEEPAGLVMQNYPRHSAPDYLPNRHVKSIVRGRQPIVINGSHVFATPRGTFDELVRPVHQGWMKEQPASHRTLRINHYAVQSFSFFKQTKQRMGAADGNPQLIRPDSWYHDYDRNECDDGVSHNFLTRLKLKVAELNAHLQDLQRSAA
jgi:hypothetical protein